MMYDFFYQNGSDHPNCLDNINAALGTQRTIIHPVNLFMNTRIASDGKITINRPLPEAGEKGVVGCARTANMTKLRDCGIMSSRRGRRCRRCLPVI